MARDKTPIDPAAHRAAHIAQAHEIIKRADRAIGTRPGAEATPLIRDMRNSMLALISEVIQG